MSDDDQTVDDLPPLPPAYSGGPPTIEEQISPFNDRLGPMGRTISSGPPMSMPQQLPEPAIRSKSPTIQGVGAPPQALVPPQIINAPDSGSVPSTSEWLPPDGVTQPDGMPAMSPSDSWDPPTDPDSSPLGLDGMPTNPYAKRLKGTVPAADAPKVEISKSMEWDVSKMDDTPAPDPALPPKVAAARRRVQAPTEVMLPALKKKKRKERSDMWLVVGLLVLVFVILALLGAVIVGVLQRVP